MARKRSIDSETHSRWARIADAIDAPESVDKDDLDLKRPFGA